MYHENNQKCRKTLFLQIFGSHSATPVFGDLLKTAKTAKIDKNTFCPILSRIVTRSASPIFLEICWNCKSSGKHLFSKIWGYSTKCHHCLYDIRWIRHNAPTFEALCHFSQRRVVSFFSWELTENSKSSKHEKDTWNTHAATKNEARQDATQVDSSRTLQSTLERFLVFLAVFAAAPVQLLLPFVVSIF